MGDKSYFSKVCLYKLTVVLALYPGDSHSSLPGKMGSTSQREIYVLLLGR